MTPKEKAEELVLKFMNLQEPNYNWFHKLLAKQCALITANEIWNELESERVFEKYDYWQEVKQEIEKL